MQFIIEELMLWIVGLGLDLSNLTEVWQFPILTTKEAKADLQGVIPVPAIKRQLPHKSDPNIQ